MALNLEIKLVKFEKEAFLSLFGSDVVNLKYKIVLSTNLWRLGSYERLLSYQSSSFVT